MTVNLEAARQANLHEATNGVAEYDGGKMAYSIIGETDGQHNRIVTVKGFSRGRMAWLEMAELLSMVQGKREVVISDQPILESKMPIVEHQARALLAVLEASGSSHMPVDFVAHSFGCVILAKAAEMAKQNNMDMTPFDSSKGGHSVFIAPGGTNADENPLKVSLRFYKHSKQSKKIGRLETDIFRAEIDQDRHSQRLKAVSEGRALGRERINYKLLSELGMSPAVFLYPEDLVFSHAHTQKTLSRNAESINGVSMPAEAPRGTHNDPIFNPGPTAKAVLQVLNG